MSSAHTRVSLLNPYGKHQTTGKRVYLFRMGVWHVHITVENILIDQTSGFLMITALAGAHKRGVKSFTTVRNRDSSVCMYEKERKKKKEKKGGEGRE